MKSFFNFLVIAILLITALTSSAFTGSGYNFTDLTAKEKSKRIDDLISIYVEQQKFNGSILVAENFEVVHKKGYGYANVEWNIPNSTDTKFRIASITKQFTAMLIMQLIEKGKIKLDGKITDYLPYYRKDTGDRVTIEMLLTHTSGIPSYTNKEDFFPKISRLNFKPEEMIKEHCSDDFDFEPGTQFNYNNSGYFILGAIIEEITGLTYEEALRKNIFEPLGMINSGYDWNESIIEKRAGAYDKTFSGFKNSPFVDMSTPYSAGALYSTVEDLFIWDKALQTEKLLSNKWKEEFFKPRVDALGAKYAFGWFINKKKIGDNEFDIISHDGGINGFNTRNYFIPNKGIVVILLNNAGSAPLNEITDKIISILNGEDIKPPLNSLVRHTHKILIEEGIEAALQQFKYLRNEKETFAYSEREINQLGYELLQNNKIDESLVIFKLNVEEFPKSYNTYDSYAEAWFKKGIKDSAIYYYQKSIELNPRNRGGITALKKLGVNIEEKKDAYLPEEVLRLYVGKYQLLPNFIMTVTVEGKNIYTQATGQPRIQIFPEDETHFYVKVVDAKIEFKKENEKVTGLILYQGGQTLPAAKIE